MTETCKKCGAFLGGTKPIYGIVEGSGEYVEVNEYLCEKCYKEKKAENVSK